MAAIMERQAGMISAEQLREAGFGPNVVDRLVRQRLWRRAHRAVYTADGPPITFRGRLWAAHLAGGGVISHRSAAAVFDLLPVPSGPIDVIGKGDSVDGIRVHRPRNFAPERDAVLDDGLPVTAPMRTIHDLSWGTSDHRVERLCHRAEYLGLLDARALHQLPPRRSITAALRTLADTGPQMTRSALEERFLDLVAQSGLPRPLVNATVAGLEVDFYWPQFALVVETDGAAAHLNPRAFERDRERDEILRLAELQPLRFTHRRITHQPGKVLATLRQLAS